MARRRRSGEERTVPADLGSAFAPAEGPGLDRPAPDLSARYPLGEAPLGEWSERESNLLDPDDARITEDVLDLIAELDDVDAERIDVTTEAGTVTLRGRITSEDERDAVLAAAARVPGVRDLVDELERR